MTDIQELRSRLRGAPAAPQPAPESTGKLGLLLVAACGVALGFAGVMFVPRFLSPKTLPDLAAVRTSPESAGRRPSHGAVPLKPSADIPTFRSVAGPGRAAGAINETVAIEPLSVDPRATPEEIGKAADAYCFKRAHARHPHWSKTPRLTTKDLQEFFPDDMDHFNELLHCLIIEAPARYCSASQRQMISVEINYYFLAIEHLNRMLTRLRNAPPPEPARQPDLLQPSVPKPSVPKPSVPEEVTPDRSVLAAIETRLREGVLTNADRALLGASAPKPFRDSLAAIVPLRSTCPERPWWAFWR